MMNLNSSQINALTSLIYTELLESIREKEKKLIDSILNNPEFIEAYNKFNNDIKEAARLIKEADKLKESAYDSFLKKFPADYFAAKHTLKAAAISHANFICRRKEKSIKKKDIKEKIALYSIDKSTIEAIKNSIINLYEKEQ